MNVFYFGCEKNRYYLRNSVFVECGVLESGDHEDVRVALGWKSLSASDCVLGKIFHLNIHDFAMRVMFVGESVGDMIGIL